MLMEDIVFLTPDTLIFNRMYHYFIPLLRTSMRMAMSSPKRVEARSKVTIDFLLLIVQLLN
jgi:hypothetical protein